MDLLRAKNWLAYAVIVAAIGMNTWIFSVKEKEGLVQATVNVSLVSGNVNGYAAAQLRWKQLPLQATSIQSLAM